MSAPHFYRLARPVLPMDGEGCETCATSGFLQTSEPFWFGEGGGATRARAAASFFGPISFADPGTEQQGNECLHATCCISNPLGQLGSNESFASTLHPWLTSQPVWSPRGKEESGRGPP